MYELSQEEQVYVIFSDVHGYYDRLGSMLEHAKKQVGEPTAYWFLGDLVRETDKNGANESKCLEILSGLENLVSIWGNHDLRRNKELKNGTVSEEELRKIGSVTFEEIEYALSPENFVEQEIHGRRVILTHGSPEGTIAYRIERIGDLSVIEEYAAEFPRTSELHIFPTERLRSRCKRIIEGYKIDLNTEVCEMEVLAGQLPNCVPVENALKALEPGEICFIGHYHGSYINGESVRNGGRYTVEPDKPNLICPGSVCSSVETKKPSYAVLRCTPKEVKVQFFHV